MWLISLSDAVSSELNSSYQVLMSQQMVDVRRFNLVPRFRVFLAENAVWLRMQT